MIRKNLMGTLMLLAVVDIARGADGSKPEVLVRVFDAIPGISADTLFQGEAMATKILDSAGVRLLWENVRSSSRTKSRARGCGTGGPVQTIDLRFGHSTPNHGPKAMAEAFPYDQNNGRITVFLDRVEGVLSTLPESKGRIFGHVLAHEVGHMLLRHDSHFETGLMKALWSSDDYSWIVFKNLSFTPANVSFIQSNLARVCSPVVDTLVAGAENQ
jgi:hypothetical protein